MLTHRSSLLTSSRTLVCRLRAPTSRASSSSVRASRFVEDEDTTREVFHDDVSATRTPDADVSIEQRRNGNWSSEACKRASEALSERTPPRDSQRPLLSATSATSNVSARSHSDSESNLSQYYRRAITRMRSSSQTEDASPVDVALRDEAIDGELSGVHTRVLRRSSSHTHDPSRVEPPPHPGVIDELDMQLPVQNESDVIGREDSLDSEFDVLPHEPLVLRPTSLTSRTAATERVRKTPTTLSPQTTPSAPAETTAHDPWQAIEVQLKHRPTPGSESSDVTRATPRVQRQSSSPDLDRPTSPLVTPYVPAKDRLKQYRVASTPATAAHDSVMTSSFMTAKTSQNDSAQSSASGAERQTSMTSLPDTPSSGGQIERDLRNMTSWRCDVCSSVNRERRTCEVCGTSKSRFSTALSPDFDALAYTPASTSSSTPATPTSTQPKSRQNSRTVKYFEKKVYDTYDDVSSQPADATDLSITSTPASVEKTKSRADDAFVVRDSTDVCVIERTCTPPITTSTPKTHAMTSHSSSSDQRTLAPSTSQAATPPTSLPVTSDSTSSSQHHTPTSPRLSPLASTPAHPSAAVKREPSLLLYKYKKKFDEKDPLQSSQKLKYATGTMPRHRVTAKSTSHLAPPSSHAAKPTAVSSSHLDKVASDGGAARGVPEAMSRNDRLRKPFKRCDRVFCSCIAHCINLHRFPAHC